MTLAFSTEISGNETLFPEKIIRSLDISEPKKMTQFDLYCEVKPFEKWLNINDFFVLKSKIHTIRKDEKDRWKVGNKIHFVINNRTKNRFQFAPVTKVKSIQRIDVYKVANVYTPYTYKTNNNNTYQIAVDGKCLNADNMHKLVINDGFDDLESFFDWFVDDFSGKLIHWTDARY